jgi:hypothetical protein
MLFERQAQDIINQHIDILINLNGDLSSIEHGRIKGEKPLKKLLKSSRVLLPKVAH